MKSVKKILGLTILSTALCLGGCGEKEDKIIDTTNYTITVGGEWQQLDMQVVDGAISIAKSNEESINVMPVPIIQPGLEDMTLEEYKDLIEQGLQMQPGTEITTLEIQKREIGEVVYFEGTSTTTKEMIQESLDAGIINEEAVEEVGGIEVYENGVVTQQVCVYYLNDGEATVFTGQVTNGVKIDDVKSELEEIIKTIVIK